MKYKAKRKTNEPRRNQKLREETRVPVDWELLWTAAEVFKPM